MVLGPLFSRILPSPHEAVIDFRVNFFLVIFNLERVTYIPKIQRQNTEVSQKSKLITENTWAMADEIKNREG